MSYIRLWLYCLPLYRSRGLGAGGGIQGRGAGGITLRPMQRSITLRRELAGRSASIGGGNLQ
jgi:hypothetical protein